MARESPLLGLAVRVVLASPLVFVVGEVAVGDVMSREMGIVPDVYIEVGLSTSTSC